MYFYLESSILKVKFMLEIQKMKNPEFSILIKMEVPLQTYIFNVIWSESRHEMPCTLLCSMPMSLVLELDQNFLCLTNLWISWMKLYIKNKEHLHMDCFWSLKTDGGLTKVDQNKSVTQHAVFYMNTLNPLWLVRPKSWEIGVHFENNFPEYVIP